MKRSRMSRDVASKNQGPADEPAGDVGRLARHSAVTLSAAGLGAVGAFLLTVVITRGLGRGDAGAVVTLFALFSVASAVATFGAPAGLIRSVSRSRAVEEPGEIMPVVLAACLSVAVVGLLLGIILLVEHRWIAETLGLEGPAVDRAMRWLAPVLPLDAVSVCVLAAARGLGNIRPYVVVENISKPLIRVGAVSAAVALGFGVAGVAAAWSLAIPVALAVGLFWFSQITTNFPLARVTWPSEVLRALRVFWAYTVFQGLGAVFQVGILWLDILLVSHYRPGGDAAVYGAASRYMQFGGLALTALIVVSGPEIAYLMARGGTERVRIMYVTGTAWVVLLTFPIYLSLFVYSDAFMTVFGPSYVSGVTPLEILSLAMLIAMGTGPIVVLLQMGGRGRWNLCNAGAALAANIALNLALIPRFGITGAAIAWAVSICIQNLAPVMQTTLFWRLHPFTHEVALAALVTGASFGLLGVAIRTAVGSSPRVAVGSFALSTVLFAGLAWSARQPLRLTEAWKAIGGRRLGPAEGWGR
jgi:O-antigen/teichoic acid export membrane protein